MLDANNVTEHGDWSPIVAVFHVVKSENETNNVAVLELVRGAVSDCLNTAALQPTDCRSDWICTVGPRLLMGGNDPFVEICGRIGPSGAKFAREEDRNAEVVAPVPRATILPLATFQVSVVESRHACHVPVESLTVSS